MHKKNWNPFNSDFNFFSQPQKKNLFNKHSHISLPFYLLTDLQLGESNARLARDNSPQRDHSRGPLKKLWWPWSTSTTVVQCLFFERFQRASNILVQSSTTYHPNNTEFFESSASNSAGTGESFDIIQWRSIPRNFGNSKYKKCLFKWNQHSN